MQAAVGLFEGAGGDGGVVEVEGVEEGLAEPVTFFEYPKSPEYLITLRRKINSILIRNEKV